MRKSIRGTKKSRGRPRTTGAGVQIGMRWQEGELRAIDRWRHKQLDSPERPQAIRRLVELGLRFDPLKQSNPEGAAKASELAARQIDKLAHRMMPEEELRVRKRRLIKGPREFREMRGDQPKNKKT